MASGKSGLRLGEKFEAILGVVGVEGENVSDTKGSADGYVGAISEGYVF